MKQEEAKGGDAILAPRTKQQDPTYTQILQVTAGRAEKTVRVRNHQFYGVGIRYVFYDFIILCTLLYFFFFNFSR